MTRRDDPWRHPSDSDATDPVASTAKRGTKKEEKNTGKGKDKAKKSGKKGKVITILVFILGLAIFLYPAFSDWYYQQEANEEKTNFDQGAAEISPAELEKRLGLAQAYNETLDPARLADPFTKRQKEGVAHYAQMLEVHQMMGHVDIPKISVSLPVYAGTADEVLEKGAGHLEGTSLPIGGKSTHAVITAHRGLPKAKLFRELDKLEKGDVFYFTNIQGVLAYQVDQILTVEPSDFAPVLVVKGEDYMTLLTCTPYMVNSHRLLVRGHRVDYTAPQKEPDLQERPIDSSYKTLFWIALAVIAVLLIILIHNRRKLRAMEAGKK